MTRTSGSRRTWILVAVAVVVALALGSPGLAREPARALPFIAIFLCAELLVVWQVVTGLRLSGRVRELMAVSHLEASRLGLRTARRGALLGAAFTLILVGNCSALANQGPGGLGAAEAAADPTGFLLAVLIVMAPIMIALALPIALASRAQRLAERGRHAAARRWAEIAVMAGMLPFFVALLSAYGSFIAAWMTCTNQPGSGACVGTSGGLAIAFVAIAPILIMPALVAMVRPLAPAPEPFPPPAERGEVAP